MIKKSVLAVTLIICLVLIISCDSNKITETDYESTTSLQKQSTTTGGLEEAIENIALNELNVKLKQKGKKVRIALAEWITNANSGEVGQTVFASDIGNKQLYAHWVPGDPNRDNRTNITWIKDQVDGSANGVLLEDVNLAINEAMQTWHNVVCSEIPLSEVQDSSEIDLGLVQLLAGFGGSDSVYADITHGGWLPGSFFDIFAPDGGNFILGITLTFIWVDDSTGTPVDMDNNGKFDVAFREIYYNNNFEWGINTHEFVDVESIVLHETGHGLSQAHFGKLFGTYANLKLHFAPLAVMNAVYIFPLQELTGSDNAGHCSIWSSWPYN